MFITAIGLLSSCTDRSPGKPKDFYKDKICLQTPGLSWHWYENTGGFDWVCKKLEGKERVVGKNRRGGTNPTRYDPKGDPNDPNESKRPEVWCERIRPGGQPHEGPWEPMPCPFSTMSLAEEECTEEGGIWTSQSQTRAYCAFPAGGVAVVVHDDDGDGLIYNTEFHCEGLNEEGLPDGQEIECPGED
jgi:hypothetical protein